MAREGPNGGPLAEPWNARHVGRTPTTCGVDMGLGRVKSTSCTLCRDVDAETRTQRLGIERLPDRAVGAVPLGSNEEPACVGTGTGRAEICLITTSPTRPPSWRYRSRGDPIPNHVLLAPGAYSSKSDTIHTNPFQAIGTPSKARRPQPRASLTIHQLGSPFGHRDKPNRYARLRGRQTVLT
jgi:hypothetical protein